MGKIDKQQLVRAAARARERAVAPYSKFKVGAALLAQNGEIISGANVESASYFDMLCRALAKIREFPVRELLPSAFVIP